VVMGGQRLLFIQHFDPKERLIRPGLLLEYFDFKSKILFLVLAEAECFNFKCQLNDSSDTVQSTSPTYPLFHHTYNVFFNYCCYYSDA
jgi:hypothetical protein